MNMITKKEKEKIWNHIETTNREMGEVKTDIEWLKESIERIDRRTWYIATGILITVIITIGSIAIQLVS